jgi:hydrogenase-4 component B
MVGLATHQPTVTLIGFLAALYHALNHSFFKGLLFLCAGSVDYRLHTRNLNEMGGLGRLMPWTGLSFLVGALAVSAIPPFNGFISEWFTYQAFFAAASGGQDFIVRAFMPLCAALLALAGTLAVMVAIKMYGGAFTGPARSAKAGKASEVPGSMLGGMAFLAIGCIFLGLGSPLVTPYLARVVTGIFGGSPQSVASGVWVYPLNYGQALLSPPLIALLLLGLLIVPVILVGIYRGYKAGGRIVKDPWACGYGYSSQMSITANNFNQPITVTFPSIYQLRTAIVERLRVIGTWSKRILEAISRAEPVVENILKGPTTRSVDYISQRVQVLQMGDIRIYCLYIVVTLVILLIVIFR